MAGKRQHYIPRCVLKGFVSKIDHEKDLVWFFRKGDNPKEISTRDIALSKYFYSNPGPGTLDDSITEEEKYFSAALNRSRIEGYLSPSDRPAIIRFVINMAIRTKHIRTTFSDITGTITKRFVEYFSVPDNAIKHLIEDMKNEEGTFVTSLRSSLLNTPLGSDPVLIEVIIEKIRNNPDNIARLFCNEQTLKACTQGFVQFVEDINFHGVRAHKSSLERFMELDKPSERHQLYNNFIWSIEKFDSNTFVLGDICFLQMEKDSRLFTPPFFTKKDNNILLLPIAHDTLLFASDTESPNLPSPNEINENMVDFSSDFFVSSINDERENRYLLNIGSKLTSWWNKELEQCEKNYFSN